MTNLKLPHRRQFLRLVAGAAALPTVSCIARAQAYPMRPITMIGPVPPGGPSDAIGRVVAERMRASLGQPIVIENVSGAGGSIGVGRVARAAPNGYTVVIGNTDTHVLNGAAYSLPFDVLNDFEPVALLSSYPLLIVSNNAVPARNLKELIVWIKTNQEKVTQGTVGAGSLPHVCGVYLQNRIGGRWQFVPYRGGPPAMQDIVAGQIDLICVSPGSSLALVRSRQVRAYAVLGSSRLAAAPDIPTVDEAGLPGLYVPFWNALWAPKDTPRSIVASLNSAVAEALADATVRERLAELGADIPPHDRQLPEALGALHKSEIEKWWPIIKAARIKAD